MVKIIVAGSRDIDDWEFVDWAIWKAHEYEFVISELVSGKARGVDSLGEHWAEINGCPVKSFPANWNKFGNAAGPIRNKEMADYADALIAIWDGESSGTRNMIENMKKLDKPSFVVIYPKISILSTRMVGLFSSFTDEQKKKVLNYRDSEL